MKGSITKYRKRDGRVSWGYHFRVGSTQFAKSGYETRDAAIEAQGKAIAEATGQPLDVPVSPPPPAPVEAAAEADEEDPRTVKEYLSYWLDEHAALRCAPSTMELYRKLAKYITEHLGDKRISKLKTADIQETVNRLQLRGGSKTEKHPEGKPL
jgi:hypothetical protein